ncbi:hypothetical protein SAMN05216223_13163 [Actinacidiphila yanglinensis]|uniref:Uncharacterized protein n=1 Tax=Actinacidiphila yanglinensis TaxID=310779 RepID=A0A1H6EAL3_9ACTN|nr:hypothetical protein [Actinacidiphila yanglinensis]SEG94908.1 hypothetical protein SAMN05216223_13163 [Actinacidiphila yanglinensis]
MLTLAGYRVDLDPQLNTRHAVPVDDPHSGYRLSDQLRAPTEAMGAETYDSAANLTDQVVDDVHGLPPALTQFLQAAGQQALTASTEPPPVPPQTSKKPPARSPASPRAWPTPTNTSVVSARPIAPEPPAAGIGGTAPPAHGH